MVFQTTYLKQKEELKQIRSRTRTTFLKEHTSFLKSFGQTISSVRRMREKREWPRIDTKIARDELQHGREDLQSLTEELDREFLTDSERRRLRTLERQIDRSVEYLIVTQQYEEYETEIKEKEKQFKSIYRPYSNLEQYMTSQDRELLSSIGREVHAQTADFLREFPVDILPAGRYDEIRSRRDWYADQLEQIPKYNGIFVCKQQAEYSDALTSSRGSLNEQQQKAVIRNDQHNLVDASAGTGKTLTLTHRFLYLYRLGVSVDDIIAITFTNTAVEEMKDRIADSLNQVDRSDLQIYTFHKISMKIIEDSMKEGMNMSYVSAESSYLDSLISGFVDNKSWVVENFPEEVEQFSREHEVFRELNDNSGDLNKYTEDYKRFVRHAWNFGLSPDAIHEKLTTAKRRQYHFSRAGIAILRAFTQACKERESPLDFQDMLNSATRIVEENPEVFKTEFQHILVDEFQDVSETEVRFLEGFLGQNSDTHLFVVGDDWQSIYGFRGSNPRYFIEFEDRFDGVEQTQLKTNYRSPPDIVEASADLMRKSTVRQNQKSVEAFKNGDCDPGLHRFGGDYEIRFSEYVADLVERSAEEGTSLSDILILSRNNKNSPYMKKIRETLVDREITHSRSGSENDPGEGVLIQSIHSSKGTEAEHVILVHAVETEHGLPSPEKENELFEPAIANTGDYYSEERRLCYVALTRTEKKLDVITQSGVESRYIQDIEDAFTPINVPVEPVEGKIVEYSDPGPDSNQPIKGMLDCNGSLIRFMAWDSWNPPELREGQHCKIENPIFNRSSKYGLELQLEPEVNINLGRKSKS